MSTLQSCIAHFDLKGGSINSPFLNIFHRMTFDTKPTLQSVPSVKIFARRQYSGKGGGCFCDWSSGIATLGTVNPQSSDEIVGSVCIVICDNGPSLDTQQKTGVLHRDTLVAQSGQEVLVEMSDPSLGQPDAGNGRRTCSWWWTNWNPGANWE